MHKALRPKPVAAMLATRLRDRPTTGARSRTRPLLGLASLKKKSLFRPNMSSRRASAILETWVSGRLMKTPGGWAYFSAAWLSVLGVATPAVDAWAGRSCRPPATAKPEVPQASAPVAPAWRKSCLRVSRVRVKANLISKPNYQQLNPSMALHVATILSVNPGFLPDITIRWGARLVTRRNPRTWGGPICIPYVGDAILV